VKGKDSLRQQKKTASEEAAQYESCATLLLSEFYGAFMLLIFKFPRSGLVQLDFIR